MTAHRALVIMVVIILCIGLSGCIAPPKGNPTAPGSSGGTSGGTSGGSKEATPATTVPTTAPPVSGFITPATPFPTPTTERQVSNYTVFPEYTVNTTPFVAIYYDTLPFKQNRTAFSYNLTMPPLIIDMCLSPNLTTRTIWYDSKYDDQEAVTKKVTAIGPSVWFEVTVRDPATGTIIAKDGFAKSYSVDTAKRVTIRNPGPCLIEFAGNEVSAEIQVRVPKTGDQTGAALRNLSCSQPLLQ
jgi:hypothetical protein